MQTRHRGTVGTMKAETGDGSASRRAPDSQQTRRGRGRGREHGLPNSPQKEPTPLTPYSWTSRLWNYETRETTHYCFLSHLACGAL